LNNFTIYHNSRCSKSRQTLDILLKNNFDPIIVLYIQDPLSSAEIQEILIKLNKNPRDILRKSEQKYKELKLSNKNLSDNELIEFMQKNPKLIERPIVTRGNLAIVGRPPENVFKLIN
tara:strand:+ start:3893 stop:4246 length:354 start_codon:yes stop_codon:yes gene_type:complete